MSKRFFFDPKNQIVFNPYQMKPNYKKFGEVYFYHYYYFLWTRDFYLTDDCNKYTAKVYYYTHWFQYPAAFTRASLESLMKRKFMSSTSTRILFNCAEVETYLVSPKKA